MYCIKCGVRLDDSVTACPLCHTKLSYPEPVQKAPPPLYPKKRYPEVLTRPGAIKATLLVLFLIPLLVSFFVDLQLNGRITWFGYAAGGVVLAFIFFVFPFWFRKPDPVFLITCDLIATGTYLLYIELITLGGWFLPFALPVLILLGVWLILLILLHRRFWRHRLYVYGGALIALGGITYLIELLLEPAFGIPFFGWAYCTLGSFAIIGLLLIYLAINHQARQTVKRKFFL